MSQQPVILREQKELPRYTLLSRAKFGAVVGLIQRLYLRLRLEIGLEFRVEVELWLKLGLR